MAQGGLTVLVGTSKCVFLLTRGKARSGWDLSGPFCDGWPINHVVGDPTTGVLWAGRGGDWQGAGVWHSEDRGRTWSVAQFG